MSTDETTHSTRARAAPYAPPRAWPPLLSPSNPLMVHVRLPRESTGSNDAKLTPHERIRNPASALQGPWRRRRDDSSDEDDAGARGDGATSDSNSSATAGREEMRRKKRRKPTYVVQKEEKETLLREIRQLESRAELLRAQVGMPSLKAHETTQQRQEENLIMKQARRTQLLSLCGMQSIFAGHMRQTFSEPLKTHVQLGHDAAERRETLMRLRPEKLELACRFMECRLQGIDERLPFDDGMTWTSPEGDFCFSRTDVSHFEGVRGVKQVFDALHFFVANMEITISEVLGQLTLREDIDCVDTRATNQRLVSATDHGIVVESNDVSFSEYYESYPGRGGQEFAVFTVDSVDDDARYAYCPQERVRKDITAAITLSVAHKPARATMIADAKADTTGGDVVVAMCRSTFLTLKKPQFPISAAASEDLRDTLWAWGRVMTKTVRDHAIFSISEELGIIAIRETEEPTEPAETSITQYSLLSTLAPGVDVESNFVTCSRFFEPTDDASPAYGMGAIDYIDKDDLNPYQTATRVRKDLSACALITQTSPDPTDLLEDNVPGVSMVRFATIRLHSPRFALSKQLLSKQLLTAARDNSEQWCDVMPRVMQDRLGVL